MLLLQQKEVTSKNQKNVEVKVIKIKTITFDTKF